MVAQISRSPQQPCTLPSTAQRGPLRPFDGSEANPESKGGARMCVFVTHRYVWNGLDHLGCDMWLFTKQ